MNLSVTTFDIVFPICLGALFGVVRYSRMVHVGVPDARSRASMDALKGILGASAIIFAYKLIGIL